MDEVHEYCVRVLGAGGGEPGAPRRRDELGATGSSCRRGAGSRSRAGQEPRAGRRPAVVDGAARTGRVAGGRSPRELAAASARLPERQREALALREARCGSHTSRSPRRAADRAGGARRLLVARARLALRARRRGGDAGPTTVPDRERALTMIARRQDSEPIAGEDDDWLLAHLGSL